MEKDKIEMDIKGRVLTLKAERSNENKKGNSGYYRHERVYGSFERRVDLPANVYPDSVKAVY